MMAKTFSEAPEDGGKMPPECPLSYQLERLKKLKNAVCNEKLVLKEYSMVLGNYSDTTNNDNPALLELWLGYIDLKRSSDSDYEASISIFEKLKRNKICHLNAKLYLAWAALQVEMGQVSKACLLLQTALGSKVEPADTLRSYLAKISPKPSGQVSIGSLSQLQNQIKSELQDSKAPKTVQNDTPQGKFIPDGKLKVTQARSPPARVTISYKNSNENDEPIKEKCSNESSPKSDTVDIPSKQANDPKPKINPLKRFLGSEDRGSKNEAWYTQVNMVQSQYFESAKPGYQNFEKPLQSIPDIHRTYNSRKNEEEAVNDEPSIAKTSPRPLIPNNQIIPENIASAAPLQKDSSPQDNIQDPNSNKFRTPYPPYFHNVQKNRPQHGEKIIKINNRAYRRLELIGRGGSSKVFKIISVDGSKFLALKKVRLKGAENTAIKGYLSEINFLKRLKDNDRIITLIDYQVSLSDGNINMVLEYGEIDLARLCHKNKGFTMAPNSIRMYWEQMLRAVHAIHQENIIHSDLKPANFLLVEGELKLIDFGIANSIPNDTTNIQRDFQTGTVNYMAPEAISFIEQNTSITGSKMYLRLGRASDVWSLGCILYQLVYGQPPFAHLETIIMRLQCIVDKNYEIKYPTEVPVCTGDTKSKNGNQNADSADVVNMTVDPSLIDSIKGCLCRQHQERMTIPQLLNHPFLVPKSEPPQPMDWNINGLNPENLQKIVSEVMLVTFDKYMSDVTPSSILSSSSELAKIIAEQISKKEEINLSKFRAGVL